jgi:acyl-CoA thioester hydrolase
MTSEQPASVRVELALRHRDLDALGHVNQAVYHELLEEARAEFFHQTLPDLPFTGYVLVHVELDYRREVRIEHRRLIAECRVAELGRSRVELDNRLLLPDGEVAVEGRAVLVAWDDHSRRSRELTQHEREALLSAEPERLRE